jgi:hypothetical protein
MTWYPFIDKLVYSCILALLITWSTFKLSVDEPLDITVCARQIKIYAEQMVRTQTQSRTYNKCCECISYARIVLNPNSSVINEICPKHPPSFFDVHILSSARYKLCKTILSILNTYYTSILKWVMLAVYYRSLDLHEQPTLPRVSFSEPSRNLGL